MLVIRLTKQIIIINLLMLMPLTGLAAVKPFTGVFEGQGRACWGMLYIKQKSIEWNTSFSVCRPTSYDILEQDLDAPSPHITYMLKKRSKACRISVIEMKFDPAYPKYWDAIGYPSLESFNKRNDPDVERLQCGVRKAVTNSKN